MHASLRIGASIVMVSDGCSDKPAFEGFSLSLAVSSEAEADRAFAALAEGGKVRMPLGKTFWSPRFGMVQDRFGIGWMVNLILPGQSFVITRTFDAPRDRVWKAWTERDQLMQWFGPKGMKMTTAKLDFRAGGSFHYCLQNDGSPAMWGKFAYRVIEAPHRIVLVNSFSDEKGGVTRHPFAPNWPLEMLSTTTLSEEGGKTKVAIEWAPLNPTDEERKMFNSSHDSMKQGWSGTFDQLADYLAKA